MIFSTFFSEQAKEPGGLFCRMVMSIVFEKGNAFLNDFVSELMSVQADDRIIEIGLPQAQWDAQHLAQDFFRALEGDIRVKRDTIIVTYYNAPNADRMRMHYENLPERLAVEGIQPTMPWLYDYKLDFRFK